MSTRKFASYLNDVQSPLRHLAQQAQRLHELSRIWESTAPHGLARSCRVGRLDDGVLTLYADNGSIATRIKYLLPQLHAHFQGREGQVTSIRVEVQVKTPLEPRKSAPKSGISPRGLAALEALKSGLPESSLKLALANLIRHQEASAQHDTTDGQGREDDEQDHH